jgi:hypothetical protein
MQSRPVRKEDHQQWWSFFVFWGLRMGADKNINNAFSTSHTISCFY